MNPLVEATAILLLFTLLLAILGAAGKLPVGQSLKRALWVAAFLELAFLIRFYWDSKLMMNSAANAEQFSARQTPQEDYARLQLWDGPNYQGSRSAFSNNVFHILAGTASLKLNYQGWVVFFDQDNMNEAAAKLWLKGPAEIPDLSKVVKLVQGPNGNCLPKGNWNKTIYSFSFAGYQEPKGNCNQVIK